MKRSIRMVREVYPPDIEPENEGNQAQVCIVGDVVYGAEEPVPAEQPCLKCHCRPPGVQCETVQCAKKPGCKAIHRPNRCCPDYQCECEHNGKIYANGEKLETNPGGECKVCYCRGGEVQCAEVSCYIRKDCEGKRVPGTCCPKYDHCPPIDSVLDRNALTTEATPNTLKPIVLELWQTPFINSTEVPGSTPSLNGILEENNKVPDTDESSTAAPTFGEISKEKEEMLPRITIQEIVPERKEIPVTAPPKNLLPDLQGTLLIEEAIPTSENTSNDLNIDADPESSEVSEVFQHPPPVLRIGDKLLFLKKGELIPEKDTSSPHTVITIIGAEGLQRGGVEDSLEVHEVKIDAETDVQHISKEPLEPVAEGESPNETQAEIEILTTPQNDNRDIKPEEDSANSDTNDLELKVAESTHILSLVKKNWRKGNTETTTTMSTTQIPHINEVPTTLINNIEKPHQTGETLISTTTEAPLETEVTTTDKYESDISTISPTTHIPPTTTIPVKNRSVDIPKTGELIPDHQNPSYPPIPDIMPEVGDVSQKFEIELENDNSTTMEIKILPDVLDFLSNNTGPPKNLTNPEWLKIEEKNSTNETTLQGYKDMELPEELLNQKSPIDEVNNSESVENTTVSLYEPTGLVKQTLNEQNTNSSQNLSEDKPSLDSGTMLEMQPQLIAEVKIDEVESTTVLTTTEFSKDTEDLVKETFKSVTNSGNFSDASDEKEIGLKSVESIEMFESREQITPRINNSAIVIDEDASVERNTEENLSEINLEVSKEGTVSVEINKEDPTSEARDMLLSSAGVELGSVEIIDTNTKPLLTDVEIIDESKPVPGGIINTGENTPTDEVEIINVLNTPKPTKAGKVESSTYELLPTPEQAQYKKMSRRSVASENQDDDIFKDLEKELNGDTLQPTKNIAEEKAESDKVFQELLEETQNKKAQIKPQSQEQETVNNVGNAIAGFLFKGRVPDPKVFSLVGRLLVNQPA